MQLRLRGGAAFRVLIVNHSEPFELPEVFHDDPNAAALAGFLQNFITQLQTRHTDIPHPLHGPIHHIEDIVNMIMNEHQQRTEVETTTLVISYNVRLTNKYCA
jgi:hypothetical protein